MLFFGVKAITNEELLYFW